MFNHCSQNFKPFETWFLFNIKGFHDRKLLMGRCPICKCFYVELVETRVTDGKIFSDGGIKEKATKLVELCKNQVDYSSLDLKVAKMPNKKMPRGFRYGVNTIVNVKGEKKLRQRAVDFFGNRELIREVPLKTALV